MPSLDWIGKTAVLNHHAEVPYRLLHCNGSLSAGDRDSGNLLVQGDNLEALKALLPHYAGQVKCIYIDPPYNTGNESWVYNDNVNSPEMRRWLGKVVGKESEDLSRHDKWLCMMYPRLRLLREFLREDGVIFVSIDDISVHYLRILMDSIFKEGNFISQLVWKSRQNKDSRNINGVSNDHEYVVTYGNKLRGEERDPSKYANPDGDSRGPWVSASMVGIATKSARPNLHYDLIHPDSGVNYGCPEMGWRFEPKRMQRMIAESRILWPESDTGRPRQKSFFNELKQEFTGFSSIIGSGFYTRTGTKTIDEVFGERKFNFPKPYQLITQLIEQVADKDSIIMDSFAGSGTTGHAVLAANAADGGTRRFILVEMDKTIAKGVTAERLRRVVEGYDKGGDAAKPVAGLGAGFRFCRLGAALFDELGEIVGEVSFADLAAHVFFIETGSPLPKRVAEGGGPFIGAFGEKAVYLLYSPAAQGVPVEAEHNVLTPQTLRGLALPEGASGQTVRVVYAEGCALSAEQLEAERIVFRQIPYHLTQVGGATH